MRLWIGVENFAKIEKAKVCTNGYTLLVGPNNSGKTFLMQLVQGLGDKVIELIEEDIVDILLVQKSDSYSKYQISQNNIEGFISYLNDKLESNKDRIIKDIFGKDISIDKLYVDVQLEKNVIYEVDVTDGKGFESSNIRKMFNPNIPGLHNFVAKQDMEISISALSKVKKDIEESQMMLFSISVPKSNIEVVKNMLKAIFELESLFLPASRTGLMLLYRDFFANKADDAISFQLKENMLIENKERYGGFTQPIYEFLRFLQTYIEKDDTKKIYTNELVFFENKIIEGHINVNKQGVFSYSEKQGKDSVPMYLASAMINEVAPIVLALTSGRIYKRLVIDEIEASLHPEKQFELARFLNRINNRGVELMISTHSDTFVSKINNLYILSSYVEKTKDVERIQKFNLEKEDLVRTDKMYVYEFVKQTNGKSIVKEIIPDEKTGYQFDLFAKAALNLYDEAIRLGEIH